jgi:hypothetical protein
MTPAYGEIPSHFRHIFYLERRHVARERVLHPSVCALDMHRRLSSVPPSVWSSGTVPHDHGLAVSDSRGAFSVQRTREHTLFHSMKDSSNAILSLMKQEPEARSRLENNSKRFDASTLRSCNQVTHASPGEITAMTKGRVQDPFPRKRKLREPLGIIPSEMCGAVVESRFVDSHKERRIFLANAIDYLT